jgi:hypothetical protein
LTVAETGEFLKLLSLLPFAPNVAICGSCALWFFAMKQAEGAFPDWLPDDVDLFFTGHATREHMVAALQTFVQRAKTTLHIDFDVTKETVKIVDLRPRRAEPPLPRFPGISFVLHPQARSIEDAIVQFDLSVCQLAMTLQSDSDETWQRFMVTDAVASHIRRRTMECVVDLTQTTRSILSTRQRVVKYEERGFRLIESAHAPLPPQQLEWGQWSSLHQLLRRASR